MAGLGHRLDHQLAHQPPRAMRGGADVRQQNGVLASREFERHARLIGEYVEACRMDGAAAQSFDQSCLVDKRAAGDVHEDAIRSERREHLGIDQVACPGITRSDHDQHVTGLSEAENSVVDLGIDQVACPGITRCRRRRVDIVGHGRRWSRRNLRAALRSPARCGRARECRPAGPATRR